MRREQGRAAKQRVPAHQRSRSRGVGCSDNHDNGGWSCGLLRHSRVGGEESPSRASVAVPTPEAGPQTTRAPRPEPGSGLFEEGNAAHGSPSFRQDVCSPRKPTSPFCSPGSHRSPFWPLPSACYTLLQAQRGRGPHPDCPSSGRSSHLPLLCPQEAVWDAFLPTYYSGTFLGHLGPLMSPPPRAVNSTVLSRTLPAPETFELPRNGVGSRWLT